MEVGIPYSLERGIDTMDDALYLDFNEYGDPNYLRLEEVRGFGNAPLRTPTENRPQRDGAIVYDYWQGARYPLLRGRAVFNSIHVRRRMLDNLARWLHELRNTDGVLRWTPTGSEQHADAPLVEFGNPITDYERIWYTALTAGRAYDDSVAKGAYGLYRAVQNIVLNGSFETNLTGWAATNATFTRDTGLVHLGQACAKLVGTAAGNQYAAHSNTISGATAGRVYTASIWVKGEGTAIGKTFSMYLQETGGATGTETSTVSSITLTSAWQRITVTYTLLRNDRTGVTAIPYLVGGVIGDVHYTDDHIVHLGGYPHPYVHTDGSAQTNTASRLQMPMKDAQSPLSRAWTLGKLNTINLPGDAARDGGFWGHIRFKPTWANNKRSGETVVLYDEVIDGNDLVRLFYNGTTNCFVWQVQIGGVDWLATSPAQTFAGDAQVGVSFYVSPAANLMGVRATHGGAAWTTTAFTPNTYGAANVAGLGDYTAGGSPIDGDLEYAAFGRADIALTEAHHSLLAGVFYGRRLRDLVELAPELDAQAVISPGEVDAKGELTSTGETTWDATLNTAPHRDRIWVPGRRRLTVRTFEGVDAEADLTKPFMFQMIAGDPTIYSDQLKTLKTLASPWYVYPPNLGNAKSYPIIEIYGTATPVTAVDVTLLSATPDLQVRLAGISIGAGAYVEIDMLKETVVRWTAGVALNYANKVVQLNSTFFPLDIGTGNLVALTLITGVPDRIVVKWRDAWASG